MDDSRIVAGLVRSQSVFFFDEHNGCVRIALFQLPCRRYADDTAADQSDIATGRDVIHGCFPLFKRRVSGRRGPLPGLLAG